MHRTETNFIQRWIVRQQEVGNFEVGPYRTVAAPLRIIPTRTQKLRNIGLDIFRETT